MIQRFQLGSKYQYCPNGNYWQEISGIFDTEIYLFCDCSKCNGQVYVLRARKVNLPDKHIAEIVHDTRERNRLDEIRSKITTENMDEVSRSLKGHNND